MGEAARVLERQLNLTTQMGGYAGERWNLESSRADEAQVWVVER